MGVNFSEDQFLSSVFMVFKKDERHWLVVNIRPLNQLLNQISRAS